MAKKFCKDFVIGESIVNVPLKLQAVEGQTEKGVYVVFSDRSGKIPGSIPRELLDGFALSEHIGGVFLVSASVLIDKKAPIVVVSHFSEAKANEYLPAEIYSGLEPDKKEEFISLVDFYKSKLSHTGYIALIDACLTRENLERMALIPATHGYYGCYVGGALAATISVTAMVTSSMAAYVHKGNGVTTQVPNWNVLLTASLLHAFGRIDYCDETDPFKKSVRGVTMNYFSTLQHALEKIIVKQDIPLTEQEIANLLNVLAVSVASRTDVRAISKEGVVLRHILRLYGECDAIDYQMANYAAEEGEGFFWSKKLSRYLLTETAEEVKQ